jgi:hypothetical protein
MPSDEVGGKVRGNKQPNCRGTQQQKDDCDAQRDDDRQPLMARSWFRIRQTKVIE